MSNFSHTTLSLLSAFAIFICLPGNTFETFKRDKEAQSTKTEYLVTNQCPLSSNEEQSSESTDVSHIITNSNLIKHEKNQLLNRIIDRR